MNGVRIKIFYGNKYYDAEYDIEKMGYDYTIIGDAEAQGRFDALRAKIRKMNLNYSP